MKKTHVLMLCIALVVICFTLIGCSSKSSPESTPTPTIITQSENNAVIEEMVAATNDQLASMNDDTMSILVSARGNSIVYTYTAKYDIPPETEATMQPAFESMMESQKSVFTGIIDTLKSQGVDNPTVIFEYYNKDGKLLFSSEYDGQN